MMKNGNSKRVFILGAGFSVGAGMPDIGELTKRVLEETEAAQIDERNALLKTIIETSPSSANNIELIVDQLEKIINQDYVPQWLDDIDRQTTGIIIAAEYNAIKKCRYNYIKKFIDNLSPNRDTIITFNYDTLVEVAIGENDTPPKWNYALKNNEHGIIILKMHGTINLVSEKSGGTLTLKPYKDFGNLCEAQGYDKDKGDDEYNGNDETKNYCEVIDFLNFENCHRKTARLRLGTKKDPNKFRWLYKKIWPKAANAIIEADEIYVIGYSASNHDKAANDHFKDATSKRKSTLERVVVVDPGADEKLECRIFQIFGVKPRIEKTKAEEVNWHALLS